MDEEHARSTTEDALRWGIWWWLAHDASGEFLLDKHANGGTVILARTVMTTVLIYGVAVGARAVINPASLSSFSSSELRKAIFDTFPRFGAIFAGVYAAFYSRFSSQWTYLADLYNDVKSTEAQVAGGHANGVLAE